jgi:predicted small lipoprotein YifL
MNKLKCLLLVTLIGVTVAACGKRGVLEPPEGYERGAMAVVASAS